MKNQEPDFEISCDPTVGWQTVKVFISSTFRDMGAERDVLVKTTFPQLRERLAPFHVNVIDIDLRWGVTNEQVESGQALELCLDAIDDCRPFFIGLLGEVYGNIYTGYDLSTVRHPWLNQFPELSMTELEFIYGTMLDPTDVSQALFYFRQPQAVAQIPDSIRHEQYLESDGDCIAKLNNLKDKIRGSGAKLWDGYPASWHIDKTDPFSLRKGAIASLDKFTERVTDDLFRAIKTSLQLPETPYHATATDSFEIDLTSHRLFAETATAGFIEREAIHSKLMAYLENSDDQPLMLLGDTGMGKTSMMAAVLQHCIENFPDEIVIPHFVGATAASFSLSNALGRFCEAIKRAGKMDINVPDGNLQRKLLFKTILNKVPEGKRLIILLDGLGEMVFADKAFQLEWLPDTLPENVSIICSSRLVYPVQTKVKTQDGNTMHIIINKRSLREELPEAKDFAVSRGFPILELPSFSYAESRSLIDAATNLRAKKLDESQQAHLASLRMARNPLFLSVLLEELRLFGSFENLTDFISVMPDPEIRDKDLYNISIMPIFSRLIQRLEDEYGKDITNQTLRLLALTRSGLSETELLTLITVKARTGQVAAILRQLRSYLYMHEGLYNIRSGPLRLAITFNLKTSLVRSLHMKLAKFFESLPNCARKATELYYHFYKGSGEDDEDDVSMFRYTLNDLDLLRQAWDLDRDSVWEQFRAAQSYSLGMDLGNWAAWIDMAAEKCTELEEQAHDAFSIGNLEEVIRLFRQMEVLAALSHDEKRLRLARANLMITYIKQHRPDLSVSVYEEFRDGCFSGQVSDELVHPLITTTLCCLQEEQPDAVIEFAGELKRLLKSPVTRKILGSITDEAGYITELASGLSGLAAELIKAEQYGSARSLFLLEARLWLLRGYPEYVAVAASGAGVALALDKEPMKSFRLFKYSIALHRKAGRLEAMVAPLQDGVKVSLLAQRPIAALNLIRECIEAVPLGEGLAHFEHMDAFMDCIDHVFDGVSTVQPDAVRRSLQQMHHHLGKYQDGFLLPILYCKQARFEEHLGEFRNALKYFDSAYEVAALAEARQLVALEKARFLHRTGSDEKALLQLDAILPKGFNLNDNTILAQARELLAEIVGDAPVPLQISGSQITEFKATKCYSFLVVHPDGMNPVNCAAIVKAVIPLDCDVQVQFNGKKADAKSIMGLMMLAVETGAILRLQFSADIKRDELLIPEDVVVWLPSDFQLNFECRNCKNIVPVAYKEIGSYHSCPGCNALNRLGSAKRVEN